MELVSKARLMPQIYRTRGERLPSTLSLAEWSRTVADFGGRCAYCETSPAEKMDHFVPVSRGGGTTPGNCVPACAACDSHKWARHPDDLAALFGAATVARVRAYLATRSTGADVIPRPAKPRNVRRIDGPMVTVTMTRETRRVMEEGVAMVRRTGGRLSMTVTDALREGADLWLAAHPAPKTKRSKGGDR